MSKIYSFVFLYFIISVNAQVTFKKNTIIESGQAPNVTLVCDLDNDGYNDVIVGKNTSSNLVWFKNLDGKGNFSSSKSINNESDGISYIKTIDIDKDGDLDIFALKEVSATIYRIIFLEHLDGKGTFGSPKFIGNYYIYGTPVFFDVDKDGDDDLCYSYYKTSSNYTVYFVWAENTDGKGTFTKEHLITSSEAPSKFSAIDLDQDNDLDILTNDSDIYINSGTGIFTRTYDGSSSYSLLSSIGDFDNDGDLDTANFKTLGYSNNTIRIIYNNGIGGISTKTVFNLGTQQAISLLNMDVDEDGKIDIIVFTFNEVFWIKNLGNSTFSSKRLITTEINNSTLGSGGTKTNNQNLSYGDLDGDNKLDLVTVSNYDQRVRWYKKNNEEFIKQDYLIYTIAPVYDYQILDFDKDGDADFSLFSFYDFILRINNNSLGQFEFPKKISPFITNESTNGNDKFHYDDIDYDGDIDILFTKQTANFPNKTNEIVWLENIDDLNLKYTEHSIFTETNVSSSIYNIQNLVFNDFDGDNISDILVNYSLDNKNTFYLLKNDGKANFNKSILNIKANTFKIFDYDNDNDLDIISNQSYNTFFYKNIDGKGNFILDNTRADIKEITNFIDLDNDNDLDIIYFDNSYKLSWFENTDGKGNYSLQKSINFPKSFFSSDKLFFTDIDNDNDVDIFITNYDNNLLKLYTNIGNNIFDNGNIISSNFYSNSLDFIDIDNDGKKDIFAKNIYNFNQEIAWFQNLGKTLNTSDIKNEISIYPNPFKDYIKINLNNIKLIKLIDILGNEIRYSNENFINTQNILPGNYFLIIIDRNGKTYYKKLIKF